MCAKLHLRMSSFELKMWRVIKLGGVTRSEERKMASSMDLRLKQRAVIEFLTAEGYSPIEIFYRMKAVYGEMCLYVSTVRRWTRRSRKENPSESTVHDQTVLVDHCQRQTLSTNLVLISRFVKIAASSRLTLVLK